MRLVNIVIVHRSKKTRPAGFSVEYLGGQNMRINPSILEYVSKLFGDSNFPGRPPQPVFDWILPTGF